MRSHGDSLQQVNDLIGKPGAAITATVSMIHYSPAAGLWAVRLIVHYVT
jgi:hypothetical protein